MTSWKIFQGTPKAPHNGIERLPPPPSWRSFATEQQERGKDYQVRGEEVELVNAALYLRRPLLVAGKPGTGKTSLAYAVAEELQLGKVLRWDITTRSTLQQGLYRYDAIGRVQDAKGVGEDNLAEIGKYVQLGPLGTAMLSSKHPRVLLIDEIDKSDIDLPNDLLNILEEGKFEIPELARIADKFPEICVQTYDDKTETITRGKIPCKEFPFVVLTSNDEREFPPAFLRRCLRLNLRQPTREELETIVKAYLGDRILEQAKPIVEKFVKRREEGDLATDQLLNAIYLIAGTSNTVVSSEQDKEKLIELLLPYLSSTEGM